MNKGLFPGMGFAKPGPFRAYPRYDARTWPAWASWMGTMGQDIRLKRTTVASSQITDVAFNGLVGVAVSKAGTTQKSSDGGLTWAAGGALPAGANWHSVVYSKVSGLFVAINCDNTANACATSPDGTAWTLRASLIAGVWTKPAIDPTAGTLLVMTSASSAGYTSADGGLTWTVRAGTLSGSRCVVFAQGLFVSICSDGSSIGVMTSPTGVVWTTRVAFGVFTLAETVVGCAGGPLGFTAFCTNATNKTSSQVSSLDGILWQMKASSLPQGEPPALVQTNALTYNNNLYLFAHSSGLYSSWDGQTWRGPAVPLMPGVMASPVNLSPGSDRLFLAYGVAATTSLVYTDPLAQDLFYVP